MSAAEIPVDWMELRLRYALHANAVDLPALAEDFGLDEDDVCAMAAVVARDMGVMWLCPHVVVRN